MLPDFMIIGAMKSATSTLHEQLARQPGIFMTTPKEPYFFSDDPVYAKGLGWYESLYADAAPNALKGESSTHYAKLPTYPETIARIQAHTPDAKFIYIMRHPIERLTSQYIHHWTEKAVSVPIDEAIDSLPILVDYSRYTMQLRPWIDAFGQDRVLPVFFNHLRTHPQIALERVCKFLGYDGTPVWDDSDEQRNVSRDRLQDNALRDFFVEMPILSTIRKRLVPQSIRDKIKSKWQVTERPELSPESYLKLSRIFNEDLALLGAWLGVQLDCESFKAVTRENPLEWEKEPHAA